MTRKQFLLSLATCLLGLVGRPAFGAWSQTIDDSQAQFQTFPAGAIQTALDPTAVGGSYQFISDWGDNNAAASGTVKYQLSGVPAGNNLYTISFSSPVNPTFGTPGSVAQWHIFNVAADGTENNTQSIPWTGQFGTNQQWLGPNSGYNPGAFTPLGPGPQSDSSLGGGTQVWLNGSGSGQPFIYVKYQPWYTSPIAFDAITVTQVPEPGTIALALCGLGGFGFVAWRRRRAARA